MYLLEERTQVVAHAQMLTSHKLVRGTGGNISILNRDSGLLAITPSGIPYEQMTAADIVVMDLEGNIVEGNRTPSSEKDMHIACFRARDDINAVVHTHSTFATVLACIGKPLAPIHYLIGYGGGDTVPCIPYYPFGTTELALHVGEAFRTAGRNAILMGNHGLTAVGASITKTFDAAEELEFVSELYYRTLLLGGGNLLTPEQMTFVHNSFKNYGQKESSVHPIQTL